MADLSTATIDPPVDPSHWAELLASWLVGAAPIDRDAWQSTNRRARVLRDSLTLASFWTDEVLDFLFELPAALAPQSSKPPREDDWRRLTEILEWPASAPWAADLVEVRGPSWWSEAASDQPGSRGRARGTDRAIAARRLLETPERRARLGESRRRLASFGSVGCALTLLKAALAAVPEQEQAEFLKVVLDHADATLRREAARSLPNEPNLNPLVFLPLEVRALAESDQEARLLTLLEKATAAPSCLTAVLGSFVETAAARPETRPILQAALTRFLEDADTVRLRSLLRWGLKLGPSAIDWFGLYLEAPPPRRTAWNVGDKSADYSSARCSRRSPRWSSVWPAERRCRRRSCRGPWRRSSYQTNPTRDRATRRGRAFISTVSARISRCSADCSRARRVSLGSATGWSRQRRAVNCRQPIRRGWSVAEVSRVP